MNFGFSLLSSLCRLSFVPYEAPVESLAGCWNGEAKKLPATLDFFAFVKYAKCPELLIP